MSCYCVHCTAMPPPGFEPATPASERQQTHALDHAATGIGIGPISWHISEKKNSIRRVDYLPTIQLHL